MIFLLRRFSKKRLSPTQLFQSTQRIDEGPRFLPKRPFVPFFLLLSHLDQRENIYFLLYRGELTQTFLFYTLLFDIFKILPPFCANLRFFDDFLFLGHERRALRFFLFTSFTPMHGTRTTSLILPPGF